MAIPNQMRESSFVMNLGDKNQIKSSYYELFWEAVRIYK